MSELRCKECGAPLEQGMRECPACGCPVEEEKKKQAAVSKGKAAVKLNIMAVVSLLIGIAIVIMGMNVMHKEANISTYSAKHYDIDYAAFGADFYTDIYEASDVIVDELSDINGGMEKISESIAEMANGIYEPIGMMIMAIGLGVIAVSCKDILKQNRIWGNRSE